MFSHIYVIKSSLSVQLITFKNNIFDTPHVFLIIFQQIKFCGQLKVHTFIIVLELFTYTKCPFSVNFKHCFSFRMDGTLQNNFSFAVSLVALSRMLIRETMLIFLQLHSCVICFCSSFRYFEILLYIRSYCGIQFKSIVRLRENHLPLCIS